MKILFVDDIRVPQLKDDIEVVRNYNDAISCLKNNTYDYISLDHDLGEDKTGYDIAKYIVENQIKVGAVAIHSANPVGRDNIKQLLTHYGYEVL